MIASTASPSHRRLCLLGVGNGNDVDLEVLANHFDEICLVDLDEASLRQCVDGLSVTAANRTKMRGRVDLSCVLSQLDSLHGNVAVPGQTLDDLVSMARDLPPKIDLGRWDVVVSTCLLSQLIDSVFIAVGPTHPRSTELALAVRDGHLAQLEAVVCEGGKTLLITDFVSSDTLPQLRDVASDSLQSLVHQAVANRNFFTGLNPAVLLQQMRKGQVSVKAYPAWRWVLGPRCFAVCAVETASGGLITG
ncbi:hypothetical protein RMSM_02672 [Rhodopirellula maiorica SM1]|uniref:Uncharacterized protein n=2 Tax=Novipirellula TaxID=2795426 RepID=M5RM64_9BACT|nr:hypothetical protein RMSM_02672 [Rhodopirellula maiorica SM1]